MEKQYEIIVTPDAEINLIDLWNYITFVLMVPEVADSFIDRLTTDAATLYRFPYRHELVPEEPWHSRGVRKFLSNAYWIYYFVDEEKDIVKILNYIMTSRDQLKAIIRTMI